MINMQRLASFFGLEGKSAVVTGSGQGIGRAIATLLADAGASVVVADLNTETAASVAASINTAGGKATSTFLDVSDLASIDQLVAFTQAAYGGIDIWVNNAGIFPKMPFTEVTPALWDKVEAVNMRGAFFCMQAAVKDMKRHEKGGRIVNLSSVASRNVTIYDQPHYSATKAGVSAMTRAAAAEFAADNILVNGICPGGVGTEGAASSQTVMPRGPIMGAGRMPLNRVATPDEIAAAVLYLVGPAGAYVTGHEIVVDGGFLVS
ncbi:MAG: SDR family oxidoreductase [Acidocella sp.]|nr:SDR family oxidoreductase [Acidocella sp.]